MFIEHNNVVWGDKCSCGKDCFILQNKFHPWMENDFIIKIICPTCGNMLEIDKNKASTFYNNKIFSYFNNTNGNIVDLGCGGGFLSRFLLNNNNVNKVYSVDIDSSCKNSIDNIEDKRICFINSDVKDIRNEFKNKEIDYLVHRDLFMFVEDTDKYFDDVTEIVLKGIKHMGWYMSNNPRMKNDLKPEEIRNELIKRGWMANLEYLDWYKCGYYIEAYK